MHGLKNLTGCSVDNRLLLSRAIALIALLRKVDESVPLDAICVYLDEVDCSGLRSILLSADQIKRIDSNAVDSYRDYGLRSWRVFGQDSQLVMPEAVVKMVKEYIARVWWDHASILSDYGWPSQHYSDNLNGCYGSNLRSDIHLRVYPQYIIAALNAFNPIGDTLVEMSDAITALLTVLRSNMPTEYVAEYDCKLEEKRQAYTATPLTNRHITKLNSLRYALINAFDRPSAGSVMPDPVTKDLILNAIEIMTILFPPGDMSVQKALRARVLYEYDRLGTNAYQINTLQNTTRCGIYGSNERNNYRDRMDGYTNAIAEMCGKLSPAAAIIFGQYYSFRYYAMGEKEGYVANFIENTILDSSLRDLIADKSRITPEVALFFVKEAELFEHRLAGSFKFFNRKDQMVRNNESDCCKDEPVPCEVCAESFYPCVLGKYSVGLS